MLRRYLSRWIDRFEAAFDYDASYMRHVLRVSPASLLKFAVGTRAPDAKAAPAEAMAAHPEGHHVWLRLPPVRNAAAFTERIRRSGLAVVPGSAFIVPPAGSAQHGENALRVSLGAARNLDTLEGALTRIAAAMGEDDDTPPEIV